MTVRSRYVRSLTLAALCITTIGQADERRPPPSQPPDVNLTVEGDHVTVDGPTVNVGGDSLTLGGDSLALDAGDTSINVPRSAPGFGVAGVYSSHPCVLGWSATLSGIGGGIGGGRQRVDPECTKREWARIVAAFGWMDSAHEIVCSSEDVAFIARCQDGYVAIEPTVVMAQVSEEEFEEAQEQVEVRISQQQNLIDSLEQQHSADEETIARLEREAEALRQDQESAREMIEQDQMKQQSQRSALFDILARIEAEEAEEAEADE